MDNLDDFSLMGIFDWLELRDLLKLSTLRTRFQQLIEVHYIRPKYHLHDRWFFINVGDKVRMEYNKDRYDSVIADELPEILSILQSSGHILKFVQIENFPIGHRHLAELQQSINKYCAKAFQHARLVVDHNTDFLLGMHVNISFTNAKSINLARYVDDIDPIRLDKAFPRMQKLTVINELDLNHHYPYLTETIFNTVGVLRNMSTLLEFMRLNPQLSHIELPIWNDAAYLETSSELLSNLYSLTLTIHSRAYTINALSVARFKSVKKMLVKTDRYVSPHNWNQENLHQLLASLQFDHLESFTVASTHPNSQDFIIQLIVRNTELRSVLINSDMSFDQLSRLIEPLPELKELTVACSELLTCVTINRFLEYAIASNHALAKFTILFPHHSDMTKRDLLEFIPRGWSYGEGLASENRRVFQLERSE